MKTLHKHFMESLRASIDSSSVNLSEFITTKTFLSGKVFSFKDHEFQEYIVKLIENNKGYTFSVSKSSQIGLSEIFNRIILARMAVRANTSAIISFPSISFSMEIFKTRISPIIADSPTLRSLSDYKVDSASVKQFFNGSIMYALGGSDSGSKTALLNRPVDTILVDELDRQSSKIVSGYRSRMTHTPPQDRLIMKVSTPTLADVGIDAEVKGCRELHTPWVGCPCGHEFIADFYKDIVIPGFDENLLMLTKEKASRLDTDESYLQCPECKGKLDETNKKTIWHVTYNPEGGKKQIGVKLDPFCAMSFISIPDLVEASIEYTSHIEFLNQGLGKVAARSDSTIQKEVVHFTNNSNNLGAHIYGLDLGKVCHYMHGVLKSDTTVHVVDTQVVPLAKLEEFLIEQNAMYTFTAGVADSQPYSDLIYKLIRKYPRMFSAIYVSPNPPKPEMYSLKLVDKYGEMVRQVSINKSLAMDTWVDSLNDFWSWEPSVMDATILQHLLDMRRGRDYRFEEMIYKWVKSEKGNDHFFHTAVYLFMASKLAVAGINTTFSPPVMIGKMNPELKRRGRRGVRL